MYHFNNNFKKLIYWKHW